MNFEENTKKYCVVKINFIQEDPYYVFKLNNKNINKLNLTFFVNKNHILSDLIFLISIIKKTFKFDEYYNLIFNFKNCPKKVRELKEIQQNIREILQVKKNKHSITDSKNIYILSNIIISHSLKHGKHPNFKDFNNPIIYEKIKNYINNILNTKYDDTIIKNIIFNINNIV